MTDLWTNLDRIIDAAPDAGALRTHGLGPIAAWRMRGRGEAVPPEIDRLAHGAAYAAVTAAPLLQKVIDILQEPVLVLKGPEVARLYPERTLRTYGDLDLLVADLPTAERKLLDAGFAELMPGKKVPGKHHDSPLALPGLALTVELHRDPGWLPWLTAPSAAELLGTAVPSSTEVAGAFGLLPEQLALFLANHSWRHGPYSSLVHLIDIDLLRQVINPSKISTLARLWGMEKVWRFTGAMIDWYIYRCGDSPNRIHRYWASHLFNLRERTTSEFYLSRVGKITAAPTTVDQLSAVSKYASICVRRRSLRMD